jgi:hypothetical protein
MSREDKRRNSRRLLLAVASPDRLDGLVWSLWDLFFQVKWVLMRSGENVKPFPKGLLPDPIDPKDNQPRDAQVPCTK